MEEGAIASWQKKVGDFVEEGEVLLEIETDKATMEYESPEEGTLLKIFVEAGSRCALNAPIAVLGEEGDDIEAALKEFTASMSSSAGSHGGSDHTDSSNPDAHSEVVKQDSSISSQASNSSGCLLYTSPSPRDRG